MKQRAWLWFLFIGLSFTILYATRPSAQMETALSQGIGFFAVVASIVGLWVYRPYPFRAWLLLAIAQAFNVIGDLFFARVYYLGDLNIPTGLFNTLYVLATIFYLGGVISMAVAFRKMMKSETILNGLILAVGTSSVVWTVLIHPNLSLNLSTEQWLQIVGYPLIVIPMLGIVSLLFMTPVGHTPSYRLFYGVILFYAIALYFSTNNSNYPPPIFPTPRPDSLYMSDFSFSLAYLMLGAVFLHPSITTLKDLPARKSIISRQDLVILGIAFLIPIGVLIYQKVQSQPVDWLPIIGSMVIIFSLIEGRLAQLVRLLEKQNRQLNSQREMLHHQAHHDALTGLPNRVFLQNVLADATERARQSGLHGAVLMIDVNDFKAVNDTLGHDQGDITLCNIADQLNHFKRHSDIVGRWGGDEFVFILEGLVAPQDAVLVARRMLSKVAYQIPLIDNSIRITLSIGGCLFMADREEPNDLIRRADQALYQAKASSGEHLAFYPAGLVESSRTGPEAGAAERD